ncbi:Crp/Fnr family transcriptional regulator [Pleurocapsa sp. CCALA 161]|uniref:Crp/Fnr family transcriptional regulator n=1 Tax=Pleurocapsa sp. CCALA 161 TaxID=2107688 RepID=UPI000D04A44E|nr:Crp/Fnr family transcriptional regulator [Pleurocapsa sp. CCALA 161]PSB12739.1 Crp/Fnr family transcriptional regulator [Pleurocapsa sp. CCALA 161]
MVHDYFRSTNRLLPALSEAEYLRLEPYLIYEPLSVGTVFYEASEKIETIYFPHSALVSLVNTLSNGTTTEIGIIGGTGMIGLPALLGDGYSSQRAVVQIGDGSVKISALILKREFDRGGELQKVLLNYAQTRLNEISQLAVCNRHHTIEERLARWLLTVQDLTQAGELPLTQEFIGNMLGCRRSGVTIAAGTLQKAGLINYHRGKITILNRQSLEVVACECYQLFYDNFYQKLGSRQ